MNRSSDSNINQNQNTLCETLDFILVLVQMTFQHKGGLWILEMCPTLGDTWPAVSTTLPEDSVWSIMMEVVRACWNLCLLSRVIELWNDRNHQEDHWLLITLYCPSVSKSLVCQYLGSFVLYLEITEATGGLTGNVSQYFHYNLSLIETGELTLENESLGISTSCCLLVTLLFCICRQETRNIQFIIICEN